MLIRHTNCFCCLQLAQKNQKKSVIGDLTPNYCLNFGLYLMCTLLWTKASNKWTKFIFFLSLANHMERPISEMHVYYLQVLCVNQSLICSQDMMSQEVDRHHFVISCLTFVWYFVIISLRIHVLFCEVTRGFDHQINDTLYTLCAV